LRIRFSILLKIFSILSLFNLIAYFAVSGSPPLLLIITAEPLLAASKLVLPNGSCHLEQTTEILALFKSFKI